MMIVIGCPMISSALKPKIRSAALFQLLTIPFRSLLIIASSEDSTIAASRSAACSAPVAMVASQCSEGPAVLSRLGRLVFPAAHGLTPLFTGSTHPPEIAQEQSVYVHFNCVTPVRQTTGE